MHPRGIYTLANDAVYDHLVALLNSLEQLAGDALPICVIPYDDRCDAVARELARRSNVSWFDDRATIARWERFVTEVWRAHPTAMDVWTRRYGTACVHRLGEHRRFCAFDGPFEQFLYLDADILVLSSVRPFFDALAGHDVVVYDDQYNGPSHVFDLAAPRLRELFSPDRLHQEIFCSGVFASHRGLFDSGRREWLLSQLRAGDAEVLYPWAPDQTILNYMALRSGQRIHNFFHALPPGVRAETCVTSPQFEERDHVLYDRGVRLPFLHYIGIPPAAVAAACGGRNIVFPYRELLLHYRYVNDPANRPVLRGRPQPYYRPPGRARRAWRRVRALLGAHP